MSWRIVFTEQASEDARTAAASKHRRAISEILAVLREDPLVNSPPYVTLQGDLRGAYSRRIDFRHRMVYQLLAEDQLVKVIRLCTPAE